MTNQDRLDLDLVNQSKQGDTLAFRDLIDVHKNTSLTLACSILKDQAIAEDAIQIAFIKVYEKLHTFKQKAKFSTWLYRIVINTSYNILKQQKNHLPIDTLNRYPEEANIDKTIEKNDQRKYIQIALNILKPDEALVLRLFYLYEKSISEIEEITGHSKSKIKVDLHRGRANMEHQLQKLLGKEIKNLL